MMFKGVRILRQVDADEVFSGGGGGGGAPSFNSSAAYGNATFGYSAEESQMPVTLRKQGFSIDGSTGDIDRGFQDAATVPFHEVVNSISQLDKEQLEAKQRDLWEGGFYADEYYTGKKKPKFGQVDEDTLKAVTTAVRETVRRGGKDTFDDVPLENGKSVMREQGFSVDKAPTKQKLTNPENVKASVKNAAVQVLGLRGDDTLAQQIADRYEQEAQSMAEEGVAVSPVSPNEAWLEEQIRTLRPESTAAFQTAGNVQAFLGMVNPQGMFSAYRR